MQCNSNKILSTHGNLIIELLMQELSEEYFSMCILISLTCKHLRNVFNLKYEKINDYLNSSITHKDVNNKFLFYRLKKLTYFLKYRCSQLIRMMDNNMQSYVKLGTMRYESEEKYQEFILQDNYFEKIRFVDKEHGIYDRFLNYHNVTEFKDLYFYEEICNLIMIIHNIYDYHDNYCDITHCDLKRRSIKIPIGLINNRKYYEINFIKFEYIVDSNKLLVLEIVTQYINNLPIFVGNFKLAYNVSLTSKRYYNILKHHFNQINTNIIIYDEMFNFDNIDELISSNYFQLRFHRFIQNYKSSDVKFFKLLYRKIYDIYNSIEIYLENHGYNYVQFLDDSFIQSYHIMTMQIMNYVSGSSQSKHHYRYNQTEILDAIQSLPYTYDFTEYMNKLCKIYCIITHYTKYLKIGSTWFDYNFFDYIFDCNHTAEYHNLVCYDLLE